MGHNLKQVVRDNAAYGLAALITHRMLMLVAERLRQFEGKVYNVRVERMMNDCLDAAIVQSVEADIKIRAYIDRIHLLMAASGGFIISSPACMMPCIFPLTLTSMS